MLTGEYTFAGELWGCSRVHMLLAHESYYNMSYLICTPQLTSQYYVQQKTKSANHLFAATSEETMQITTEDTLRWLGQLAHVLHENRDYLTQLDSPIGDADHGINMDRGFKAVTDKLPTV